MPGEGSLVKLRIGNRLLDYIPAGGNALVVEDAAGTQTTVIGPTGAIPVARITDFVLEGDLVVDDNSAAALTVGPNGDTNPVFRVVGNVSSAATGVSVTGRAAAAGVDITVLSSGTNENLVVNAKGTGTITLNPTATGNVVIGQNLAITEAKNIVLGTTTGTKIGTATTQKIGFYNATPIVQPDGWTITSFTEDKEFAGDSTTAADAVKGLASLVNDLVDLGLIGGTVSA